MLETRKRFPSGPRDSTYWLYPVGEKLIYG
jgi:hypothetical protein